MLHYRTVRKGKRSELLMMSHLVQEGFDVFQVLVDDGGIDCGVLGKNGKFYPIQIKSRAEFTKGDLITIDDFIPNLFIVIYDELSRDFWIIPVDEFDKICYHGKYKSGAPRHRLTINKKTMTPMEKFKGNNGIQILRNTANSP
jgi:hypothetical protein